MYHWWGTGRQLFGAASAATGQQHRLDLEVLIYEPHNFFLPGATRNCKGRAGILSAGMLDHMASLGLSLPPEVVQSELRAYEVHVPGQVTTIEQPVAGRRIVSVYRGTGPRGHKGRPLASFDGYLLSQAPAAGARHVAARLRRVTWEGRPVVQTDHTQNRARAGAQVISWNTWAFPAYIPVIHRSLNRTAHPARQARRAAR